MENLAIPSKPVSKFFAGTAKDEIEDNMKDTKQPSPKEILMENINIVFNITL